MSSTIDRHRPLADRPGFWLIRLANAVRTDQEGLLRPLDLGLHEAWALYVLGTGHAGRPGEIADVLGVDRTLMSRIVRKLAARGLVRRSRPDEDLRAVRLELTTAGVELAAKTDRILRRAEASLAADLTPEQTAAFIGRLLGRLERTGWDFEDV
jgi:DNA-binding MarR family transcriptional regulator